MRMLKECFEKPSQSLPRRGAERNAAEVIYTEKDKASLVVHYKKVKELYESELGIVPKSAMRELFNRSFEL